MKLQAQPWLLLKWALKEQAVSIQRAPFLEGFMKNFFSFFLHKVNTHFYYFTKMMTFKLGTYLVKEANF